MLKILKKYFLFQSCKNKHNKSITFSPYPLSKIRKRLMLLISKNTRDRNFISNGKTRIPTEYGEKGVSCFKNYMFRINCFIDCQFNTFRLRNIILDNSKLAIKTPEQSFYC